MTFYNPEQNKIENFINPNGCIIDIIWPGGYPTIFYAINGNRYCPTCAEDLYNSLDDDDDDRPTLAEIFYEGATVFCTYCNCEIESAYGDPSEEE